MRSAISFNGGKESLIILHQNLENIRKGETIVFRVKMEDEFDEIEQYIETIKSKYNLKILEFNDMKNCINDLKEIGVQIVILGVRRTDPNCSNCQIYQETDSGWPSIIRYSPLLDWSYSDVWKYIDSNKLPICSLYEEGYTSLGTRYNTFPNYYLFDGEKFKHARELEDASLEREGRIKFKLPFSFSGKVIHGKGIGKTLNFPTANLDTVLEMDQGVYYGTCILEGQEEKMVMSIGLNPNFGDKSVEVHILRKYSEDFYGSILTVNVIGFIRKMKKFLSLSHLKIQIQEDINFSKKKINNL